MTTKENRAEYRRMYYLKHREEQKAKSRAYYQAHKEEIKQKSREYGKEYRKRPEVKKRALAGRAYDSALARKNAAINKRFIANSAKYGRDVAEIVETLDGSVDVEGLWLPKDVLGGEL